MHWNHRVIKAVDNNGEESYSVREVFYNNDGTIYAYDSDPVDLTGETMEDLKQYLDWCYKSLDTPVLIDGEVIFVDYDEEFDPDLADTDLGDIDEY